MVCRNGNIRNSKKGETMIIKAGSEELWNKDFMHIFFALNCTCNFKCSYCCNQNTRKKYPAVFPKERLSSLLDEIFSLDREEYIFSLVGGEPSIYPHLEYFYAEVNKKAPKPTKIRVYTNGSRLPNLTKLIENNTNINHEIIISMHFEQKPEEEYLNLLSNFTYPHLATVKMLLQPNQLETILILKNKVVELGYQFDIDPIAIWGKLHPDYPKNEIAFLKEQKNLIHLANTYSENGEIIKEELNFLDYYTHHEKFNYQGLTCAAGKNFLRIMPDGIVTFCHKDWTKENFSVLGNSLLEYIYIYQPITCMATRCGCQETAALPKWKE